MRSWVRCPGVGWVLALYGVTATAYVWLNPVFEAPDEPSHVANANLMLREHRGPSRAEIEATVQFLEAHADPAIDDEVFNACQWKIFLLWPHPPLYSLLQTIPLGLVYPGGYDGALIPVRPDYRDRRERGYFQHRPPDPRDLSRPTLAVRLMRMVSVGLGALVVWVSAHLARVVAPWSSSLPVLAAGLLAFIPQFTFMAASVNNDVLGYLMSAVTLWVMLRVVEGRWSARRSAGLLGLCLGVGALSKWTTLCLWPLTIVVACLAYRRAGARATCALGALSVGVIIAWTVCADRARLYLDLFRFLAMGQSTFVTFSTPFFGAPPEASLAYVGRVGRMLAESFWGQFGWDQLRIDRTALALYWLMSGVAVLGWFWRREGTRFGQGAWGVRRDVLMVLAGAIGAFVGCAAMVYARIYIPQGGRYLLVVGPVLVLFWALGLMKLHAQIARRWAWVVSERAFVWGTLGVMVSLNWFVLWRSIYHAYLVAWEGG